MSAGKRKNEKAIIFKIRRCLKCDTKFKSRNKFHRVCLGCKKHPAFESPYFYHRGRIGED